MILFVNLQLFCLHLENPSNNQPNTHSINQSNSTLLPNLALTPKQNIFEIYISWLATIKWGDYGRFFKIFLYISSILYNKRFLFG